MTRARHAVGGWLATLDYHRHTLTWLAWAVAIVAAVAFVVLVLHWPHEVGAKDPAPWGSFAGDCPSWGCEGWR